VPDLRPVVSSVAFSADGKVLLAGGGDYGQGTGELRLWDVAGRRQLSDLSPAVGEVVTSVAVSPDGTKCFAAAGKQVIVIPIQDALPQTK
jgi:WD40 repeat protein